MNSIFHRVSIRKFQNKAVGKDKTEQLLKAAMAAPSAGNQQPWEFYVVTDKKKLKALSEASPYAKCTADAPMAIVLCYRTEGLRFADFAHLDMSAAAENLLLEADAQGLGAVWLGIAPDPERMDKVAAAIGLPADQKAFTVIPCGYPAEERTQQDRYDESRVHYL